MRRVFLGVRPTVDCSETLCRFQDELKALSGTAPVRWTVYPNLHLTLHFLGDSLPSQVDVLRRTLFRTWSSLGTASPFEQSLSRAVFLPDAKRPKILALAGDSVSKELGEWHRKLGEVVEELGWKPERRPFLPHVTLARFSRWEMGGLPSLPEPVIFPVKNLILYESSGTSDGRTYQPIQEFRLAPA